MHTFVITVTDDAGNSGTYTVKATRKGLAKNSATMAFFSDPAVDSPSGSALTHEFLEGGDLPW